MSDTTYFKLVQMYVKQCGSNTALWLDYTMAMKWEMTIQGAA